jgi:hypothetical protein
VLAASGAKTRYFLCFPILSPLSALYAVCPLAINRGDTREQFAVGHARGRDYILSRGGGE